MGVINDRPELEKNLKTELYLHIMKTYGDYFDDVAECYDFAEECAEEALSFMDNAITMWKSNRELEAKGLGDPSHQTKYQGKQDV